jgi:hypothetical protein
VTDGTARVISMLHISRYPSGQGRLDAIETEPS